jgi:hypothetical protein
MQQPKPKLDITGGGLDLQLRYNLRLTSVPRPTNPATLSVNLTRGSERSQDKVTVMVHLPLDLLSR